MLLGSTLWLHGSIGPVNTQHQLTLSRHSAGGNQWALGAEVTRCYERERPVCEKKSPSIINCACAVAECAGATFALRSRDRQERRRRSAKEAACTATRVLISSQLVSRWPIFGAEFEFGDGMFFDGRRRRFRRATFQVAKVNIALLSRGDMYLKRAQWRHAYLCPTWRWRCSFLLLQLLFCILCFYCFFHSSRSR